MLAREIKSISRRSAHALFAHLGRLSLFDPNTIYRKPQCLARVRYIAASALISMPDMLDRQ